MSRIEVVAIDGPAASGKTTVGRRLAAELGWRFLDTGAMYRALTLGCMRAGFKLSDARQVIDFCSNAKLELVPGEQGEDRVLLYGQDVTDQLHGENVSRNVHFIADLPEVRRIMVAKQHDLGAAGPTVSVGRDQCTVVFQDARYKFYLDASEEVRAERRRGELEAAGERVDARQQLEALRRRDKRDKDRDIGRLRIAEDAEVVDTSELTIEQVVRLLAEKVRGGTG